jgi:uncharacterized protein
LEQLFNNNKITAMKTYRVKKVVRGLVEAEIIINPSSFSFLGDIDLETAEILPQHNPNKGISIAGKILIIEESKGSSGGAVVLMTLANQGKAPAALISVKPADFNLTEGAILAKTPYGCDIDPQCLSVLKTGQKARLNLDNGLLEVY